MKRQKAKVFQSKIYDLEASRRFSGSFKRHDSDSKERFKWSFIVTILNLKDIDSEKMRRSSTLYFIGITIAVAYLLTECSSSVPLSDSEWFTAEDRIIYMIDEVDLPPEPIGGMVAVVQVLRYPEEARKEGVEGRVEVGFIVDQDGNVRSPVIIQGIGHGCDEEVIRLISNAKFTPAMKNGDPVNLEYSLPVVFRLPDLE